MNKLINNIKSEEISERFFIQTKASDFKNGTLNNTVITNYGDGEIELAKTDKGYISNGIYISNVIHTKPFKYLIMSWNSDTPDGTSIKIEAQVCVKGVWSAYHSWGTWSTSMERASAGENNSDPDAAYVDADTLIVKDKGETADAFRYRITLNTDNPEFSPSVRLLAQAIRNAGEQAIKDVKIDSTSSVDYAVNKVLDVPSYSQMIRDPKIASCICSATSMAMVLKYHGISRLIPEETAWGIYDSKYDGTGNWSFNTAYAGSYGFTSYVKYCASVNDLKKEITEGYPVIISVKYRNSENVNETFPVIHDAPIESTRGHLIVIAGFTKKDGKNYAVVNDPAAKNDSGVRLNYLESELDAAWQTSGRAAYIIHPVKNDGGTSKPVRFDAKFEPTGNVITRNGMTYKEFKLMYNDSAVDINIEPDKKLLPGITIMMSRDGNEYKYITPTSDKTLLFDTQNESGKYQFLIFIKSGKGYSAVIDWRK